MERRIFGLESEYGVTCTLRGQRRLSPDEVARYLFRRVVSWGRSSNVFLQNGARLYLDVGSHPEYATPECDSLYDLVVHDKAGERILESLVESAERRLAEESIRGTIYLFKNNTDSAGNSYGCHENYLTRRSDDVSHYGEVLIPSSSAVRCTPGPARCSRPPACDVLDRPAGRAHLGGRELGHHPQPADHQHPRRAPRRCGALPAPPRHRRRLEHERVHDVPQGRRAACLHRGLREAAAMIDVWRDADARTVDGAVRAASALPSLAACDRIDALLTVVPPPTDPDVRASIATVVDRSARARGLMNVGRYDGAAQELQGLRALAEATDHAPTLADVLESQARVQLAEGEREAAVESARTGFSTALRGGDDLMAMRIAVHIAFRKVGYERDSPGALEWTEVARSLAARIGGDAQAEANTARIDGIAHVIAFRHDEAVRELQRARDLYRELGDEMQVMVVTGDLGGALIEAGKVDEAEPLYRELIATHRDLLGESHTAVTQHLINLGILKNRQGEPEAARPFVEEAVALIEKTRPKHISLAYGLATLGNIHLDLDDAPKAIEAFERAIEIRLAQGDHSPLLTETQRSLASAYIAAGRTEEGVALLQQVVETATKQQPATSPELVATLSVAARLMSTAGQRERAQTWARQAKTLLEASEGATDWHRTHVAKTSELVLADQEP